MISRRAAKQLAIAYALYTDARHQNGEDRPAIVKNLVKRTIQLIEAQDKTGIHMIDPELLKNSITTP